MRGISKPCPPREVFPDGHESASLCEAEEAYLVNLAAAGDQASFARSEFDRLAKRKLRVVMYREQRSLCIYCERRVAEGHPAPRIDHWYPSSRDPSLALDWRNLYLSCPSPETCDSAKGDDPFRWDDTGAHMPWPVDFRYEQVVGFTSRGEIYIRSDVGLKDATREAFKFAIAERPRGGRRRHGIVNLNHPALVAARAAAVDGQHMRIQREFSSRTLTRKELEEQAIQLLDRDSRPAFVSIRVAWLRRSLGRGR